MNSTPLLQMITISKAFPGVKALDKVDFSVQPGEIMALLGENGAGKSTLMRILDGVLTPDSGQILWRGQPVQLRSPQDAKNLGISMIHQELALVPHLDVAKNIYLGREPGGLLPGTVDWATLYEQASQQLARLDLDIDPRTPVRDLPLAQQQMIEVAKALSLSAQLIVMDEPTSSLSNTEVAVLFRTMRTLRAQGVAIVFISHRLNEIFAIADRVTVLRDGGLVGSESLSNLSTDTLIRMMVGRELNATQERPAPSPPTIPPAPILELRNLSRAGILHDISFSLYEGEILGIAGLVGAGRTELAETIFGVHPPSSGDIVLHGQTLHLRRPADAIQAGIALVTEDRKGQGLFLRMEVGANISVRILNQLTRLGPIRKSQSQRIAQEYVDKLGVRTPSTQQKVRNLSGGNQQKVVIAKWLTLRPKLLILDEPTRGIDIGAKGEIHRLMRDLAAQGVGILMISSELPEVLGVSDRVLVMREGRLVAEADPRTATQDDIMRAATGAKTS